MWKYCDSISFFFFSLFFYPPHKYHISFFFPFFPPLFFSSTRTLTPFLFFLLSSFLSYHFLQTPERSFLFFFFFFFLSPFSLSTSSVTATHFLLMPLLINKCLQELIRPLRETLQLPLQTSIIHPPDPRKMGTNSIWKILLYSDFIFFCFAFWGILICKGLIFFFFFLSWFGNLL